MLLGIKCVIKKMVLSLINQQETFDDFKAWRELYLDHSNM